jgi:hypothetical protein
MEVASRTLDDVYYYDLPYNIAFNQVIYTGCLIYAPISPAITIFGFLYFGIRWLIDKYNLCVVYPKSYDAQGDMSGTMYSLGLLSLIFQQIVMFGLFAVTIPDFLFSELILALAAGQIIFYVTYQIMVTQWSLDMHIYWRPEKFMKDEDE